MIAKKADESKKFAKFKPKEEELWTKKLKRAGPEQNIKIK